MMSSERRLSGSIQLAPYPPRVDDLTYVQTDTLMSGEVFKVKSDAAAVRSGKTPRTWRFTDSEPFRAVFVSREMRG